MTAIAKGRLTRDIKEAREELTHILDSKKRGSRFYLGDPIDQMIYEIKKDLYECRFLRAQLEHGEADFTDQGEEVQIHFRIRGTAIWIDLVEGTDVYLVQGQNHYYINAKDSDFGAWAEKKKLNVETRPVRTSLDDHEDRERVIEIQDWIRMDNNVEDHVIDWLNEIFESKDDVTTHPQILERYAKKITN